MLWYRCWLETRWRFLVGAALMLCSAVATVRIYPRVVELMPLVPTTAQGELGRQIREGAELARTYPGFVWSNAFRDNLSHLATLFAVLLGSAGLLSRSGGAPFTLSLPVSRRRLLGVRFAAGLVELLALAFFPALLIPLLSPTIGETYAVGAALAHASCLFVAASVFLSLACFLSCVFDDQWKPPLITLGIGLVLALVDPLLGAPSLSLYHVMSGETFFRSGHLPWAGLVASAAASAALYQGAVVKLTRRDF